MKIYKQLIILFTTCIISSNVLANADSLLIDSIINLAKKYYKINYDSSLSYAGKAFRLSQKNHYQKGLAWSSYWKAKINYKQANYDTAIKYSFWAINAGKMIKDTFVLAKAYSNAGLSYFNINKFDSAKICQQACLEQYLLTGKKKSIAIAYNNLGSVLINLGNYKEAIFKFQKALKLFEAIDMQNGVASCMLNIGQIYDLMGNEKDTTQNNKALSYYNKALKIYKNLNDELKTAQAYNAIGIEYDQKAAIYIKLAKTRDTVNYTNTILQSNKYYKLAIENLSRGLKIYQKIGYDLGVAQITNNIGTIYMNQGKFDVALQYLNLSLSANLQSNNDKEIATSRLSIASCYKEMGKYKIAERYLNEGFENVRKVNIPILFQNYYEEYALIYNKLKDYDNAYKYHVLYTNVKDSLLKAENLTTINEVQALYKNEIQEKQLQLSRAKINEEKAIANKRKLQIYAISIFAVLLVVFAIFILRSLREKRRSNKILAEKNEFITYQQKEITASITYASRIQTAVLPQKDYIDKIFDEYFILYKPQHIVSGDFFWIKEIENRDIVIATVADCTGHGVPGAFMSMMGLSFLNEISTNNDFNSSGEILDKLRKSVINSLHQTGKEGEQKDGMDISLIAWNKKENYIEFSGANNPLYLIREKELIEFKGDKMPIGIHIKNDNFSTQKIPVRKGDCLYMFSDGYADQFGGPKGKKFKYKPLKRLLLENVDLPIFAQKQILDKTIEEWKSHINPYDNKPYEQIDDIVIFGIKI